MVPQELHLEAFETVFEVYFSLRGQEYELVDGEWDSDNSANEEESDQAGQAPGQGGSQEGLTQEQLAEMLFQALAKQDRNLMRTVARQSVQRFAGMEPGRPVGGTISANLRDGNISADRFEMEVFRQAGSRWKNFRQTVTRIISFYKTKDGNNTA
mgnify:CR=1 FL=1